MPQHHLRECQTIPVSRAAAWDFFSDPRNLARLTPPALGFEIITRDLPPRIHAGLSIHYRVRPLFGIPWRWVSEITEVKAEEWFVDEQRSGPFAFWRHEHRFRDAPGGGVEMLDQVAYRLTLGWVSEPVHVLLVRRKLAELFAFRRQAVANLYPADHLSLRPRVLPV